MTNAIFCGQNFKTFYSQFQILLILKFSCNKINIYSFKRCVDFSTLNMEAKLNRNSCCPAVETCVTWTVRYFVQTVIGVFVMQAAVTNQQYQCCHYGWVSGSDSAVLPWSQAADPNCCSSAGPVLAESSSTNPAHAHCKRLHGSCFLFPNLN